jgi:outer membrane receptor for ferrienterochelin and colicin
MSFKNLLIKAVPLSGLICMGALSSIFAQNPSTSKFNKANADSLFGLQLQEVMSLPVKEYSEVTVASNVITDERKQPVSITTITKEQLRMSGGRTLSEALMMFVPGLFLVEDQDDLIAAFRGLSADNNSKTMLLIDGQNLNTEFFWGPPDAILHSTNYDFVERVEVIRGPGSVTLGQGALLGVINIITSGSRAKSGVQAESYVSVGKAGYTTGGVGLTINNNDVKGAFYFAKNNFDGEKMRNEGWIQQQGNQGFKGGKVYDMGHRLKRTDNTMLVGSLAYKMFQLNVVRAEQKKDLYNFYRDREVFEQLLTNISLSSNFRLTDKIDFKGSISYTDDDFGLYSLSGVTMGGTRENRYGAKGILNFNELIQGNRLAVGVEYRRFEMGKANRYNNNFIANVVNTFDPATANEQLVMSYRENINLISLFAEDFYSVTNKLDLFAAFRYDDHPFWGSHFSPRAGFIYFPMENLKIRGTYQHGFRGAVGLHYAGGYRRDGHLRAANYGQISAANIPGESSLGITKPESMNSYELAVNYQPHKNLVFDVVGFYNTVSNVIDVGVIYKDPTEFPMVNIGDDIPGDWNGYWFFKNTPGTFAQLGTEAIIRYTYKGLEAQVSHSLTSVSTATKEQEDLAKNASSMYLANDNDKLHYKAFPENVTRFNLMYKVWKDKLLLSLNGLAYSKWYSPAGTKADGGKVFNLGVNFRPDRKFEFSLILKNILNDNNLYPMNSNAGGPDVSPGTPAWEARTFWGTARLKI